MQHNWVKSDPPSWDNEWRWEKCTKCQWMRRDSRAITFGKIYYYDAENSVAGTAEEPKCVPNIRSLAKAIQSKKFTRDDAKHALICLHKGMNEGEDHSPGALITEAREFYDNDGKLMYERYTGRRCSSCMEVYFKEVHELREA